MARDKAADRVAPEQLSRESEAERAPGGVGLLIIDLINEMAFDGAAEMAEAALAAAKVAKRLRHEADALGTPVIYVNDNYRQWRLGRNGLIAHCLRSNENAAALVRRIRPRSRDYLVVKPHVSGFYATSLPALLPRLGVNRVVLTGVSTEICVMFTAADAHMRAYDIWTPSDGVASARPEHSDWALQIMRNSLAAETAPTTDLTLEAWIKRGARAAGGH
jgi:nicotinamidase-related amidase